MRDILSLAWQSLRLHKLRGLLAIGGVAIGITAITGIISAETSWVKALDQTFSQLGITKIAVDPPAADAEAMRRDLTLGDVEEIRRTCTAAKSAIPISWSRMTARVGRNAQAVTVKAAGAGVEDALGLQMTAGRKLTADDVARRAPVCLMWDFVARTAFKGRNPLGQTVRIGDRAFTIVGLLNDNSGDHHYRQAMVGERAEVYIPITTAQRIPQLNGVHKIIVEADDQVGAAAQINAVLRDRLRAKAGATFTTSAGSMKDAAIRSRRRVSLFVALAGFMALLVAGMGVANLLFVSVVERTREIGMRRAMGASSWAVAWQFLAESLVLCGAGAAVGVCAAVVLTRAFFAVAFPDVVGAQNPIYSAGVERLATLQLPSAKPEIAWSAVAIAAIVAAITGVLAGLEPALAAASVQPAEAIRVSPVQRHRARSAMTVLQLALGVAAVMLLVSFYEGRAQTELAALKEGAGANAVRLQFADAIPGYSLNNSLPAIFAGLSGVAKIAHEPGDLRKLSDELSLFSYFDPRMQYRASVRAGARAMRVEGTELPVVCGTVPHALEVDVESARAADMTPKRAGPMMAEGAFFSDRDLDEARRVCVLPYSAAQALFGSGKATGQTVVIGGRPFQVSGVLAPWVEKAAAGFAPGSEKHFPVLAPVTTFAREIHSYTDMWDINQSGWYEAELRVKDTAQAPAALRQLEAALMKRIRLPKHMVVYPRGDLVSAVDVANRQRSAELRAGAGGMAALLIAIVGLVNMLLVSVHESVREVGLRRALGALRSQVGWQFVREGALMAATGAVIGLLIAAATVRWLGRLADVPVHTPAAWAAASSLGAVVIGCIASLGPALHAARIEPVEALRYE